VRPNTRLGARSVCKHRASTTSKVASISGQRVSRWMAIRCRAGVDVDDVDTHVENPGLSFAWAP